MSHMHIRAIARRILRQPSAKLTFGNFLRGRLLRHDAQLPLLNKRPRQRGVVSRHPPDPEGRRECKLLRSMPTGRERVLEYN